MELASSKSSNSLGTRQLGMLALGSLIVMLGFLAASQLAHHFGFPLDDSWIHATYARNLAVSGEWAFRPGMLSAGSTSPLWTLLLVPGFWLGVGPQWWSHLLGLACMVGLGAIAEHAVRTLDGHYRPGVPWAGLLVVTEWHLVWASVSGMETLLHAALVTLVLLMLLTADRRHSAVGLLTGICVWVRPDGLLLIPLAVLAICLRRAGRDERLRALLSYALGLCALLLPYLVFNLALAGTPLPNTFYAKQAEYAGWQSRSVLQRVGSAMLQLSVGAALLLWPALGIQFARATRARNLVMLATVGWCASYVVTYALRLPPYQHGRYFIPVLPALLVMGFLGLLRFSETNWAGARHWIVEWAWRGGLVLTQLGFLVLGARAYAEDVTLIETEMVATAAWVAQNLPPDAVVAAHDVGALGFLDDHELIDLAGLVSPEVIPFIRDQERLAEYLDTRGATHLIAFPDLYPELVAESRLVFASGGSLSPALGQGNLSVYCWRCPRADQ